MSQAKQCGEGAEYDEGGAEEISGALLMDGFRKALIGFGSQAGQEALAIYSYDKMLEVCVSDMGLTEQESHEHLSYNVLCAYAGPRTPVILTVNPEELERWFDGNDTDTEDAETSA